MVGALPEMLVLFICLNISGTSFASIMKTLCCREICVLALFLKPEIEGKRLSEKAPVMRETSEI